jgi:glycerol kinase
MMRDGLILAIDQGTSGTTILVFNAEGQPIGRAYSEFQQHYPCPGWVEHDAAEIWNSTLSLIDMALQDAETTPSRIAAIGVTNQRETVVLWERASGRPVSNAIVWQDRRTAAYCDDLKAQGREHEIRARTGLLLDPYFSATKLKWLLDQESGLRERAGELAAGTMDSWLIWNLTGGAAHVTDVSNASRTLLYNIHEKAWDPHLLALFDIPDVLLPDIGPSSGIVGHTADDLLDGARVPIAGIAGDQQAALFGQACYAPGLAKNTYGTGSFLMLNTGREPIASQNGLLTTMAWQLTGDAPSYALEGSIFVTGAAVQWLRDGLQIIDSASDTEAMARSVQSTDGVYFVPALTGLGAPHWDPYARGAIVGLTRGTSREQIVRATLESICYQVRDVLVAMQADAGILLKELRADGGAAGNAFLMQFQADMLGVPVEVPVVRETSALGAAYLAGLAIGVWGNIEDIAAQWQLDTRYEPLMSDVEADALHARWLEAVERSRGWALADEVP